MGAVREQQHSPLATYKGFVRSQLRRFGASHDELDDLIQEVWLIALARSPSFAEERATRAWLSQVCRRVAASARRSRGRTPLLHEDPPELSVEPDQVSHIEVELDEQMCMAALARLDESHLDVLTLYGGGDLSMREVAELIGEPERTVYSRYRSAINELSRDLRRSGATKPRTSSFPPLAACDSLDFSGDRESRADSGHLVLYRADERLILGRVGNVLVSRLRQRVFEESSLAMGRAVDELHKRTKEPVVLINDLDPELRLPNAMERSFLRELIRTSSPKLALVADICDSPIVRLGGSMMQALMMITRSNTSFVLVPTLDQARRWVAPHAHCTDGPLAFEQVAQAIQTLRAYP